MFQTRFFFVLPVNRVKRNESPFDRSRTTDAWMLLVYDTAKILVSREQVENQLENDRQLLEGKGLRTGCSRSRVGDDDDGGREYMDLHWREPR